jgi:hypothetical protein
MAMPAREMLDVAVAKIISHGTPLAPAAWEAWAIFLVEVFTPTLLVAVGSTCFWLVARSIAGPGRAEPSGSHVRDR